MVSDKSSGFSQQTLKQILRAFSVILQLCCSNCYRSPGIERAVLKNHYNEKNKRNQTHHSTFMAKWEKAAEHLEVNEGNLVSDKTKDTALLGAEFKPQSKVKFYTPENRG